VSDTAGVASSSQTVGPFFHLGLKAQPPRVAVPAIRLTVTVTDGDGKAVDDGLVELWNTNSFARLATGSSGSCECEIARASYINVCFFARGLLRQLHTRIYFAGDPSLASDPVFALVPESRRQTLLACPDPQAQGRWMFHLRLQGPQETVFFDI
jgi:protocatechuate 3,4-dioxygenase alpha subunit